MSRRTPTAITYLPLPTVEPPRPTPRVVLTSVVQRVAELMAWSWGEITRPVWLDKEGLR